MSMGGSPNVTTQEIDPAVKERQLALYGEAQRYAQEVPWQQYPFQQVAGFQPYQLAGQNLLASAIFGPGTHYNLGFQAPQLWQGDQTWQFRDWQGNQPGYTYPPGTTTGGGGPTGPPQTGNPDDQSNWDPQRVQEQPLVNSTATSGGRPYDMLSYYRSLNPNLEQNAYVDYGSAGMPVVRPNAGYDSDTGQYSPLKDYPYWPDTWTGGQASYPDLQSPTMGASGNTLGLQAVRDPNPNDQYEPYTPTPPVGPTNDPRAPGFEPKQTYTPGGGVTSTGYGGGTGYSLPGFNIQNALGLSQLGSAADSAEMQQIGTPNAQQFYNPFVNDVIGNSLNDLNQARQMAITGNAANATLSGAFGGDRQGVQNALTNQGFLQQAGNLSAQLRSAGFDTANQLAQQNAQRQLQASGLLGQLGQGIQGGVLNYANALQGIGSQQNALAQQMINSNVNDFYAARNYPLQGFQLQQGILQGMPTGFSVSQPNNPAAGFLGGAATGASIGSAIPGAGVPGALIGGGLGGLLGLF